MANFLLVHGAWCWQRVLPGLFQAGHDPMISAPDALLDILLSRV
jgi:hypothetical protein